jgi:hypothetical protein
MGVMALPWDGGVDLFKLFAAGPPVYGLSDQGSGFKVQNPSFEAES